MPKTVVCSYCKQKTLIGDAKYKFDRFFNCGHCGKRNGRNSTFGFDHMRVGGDPAKTGQGGIPWLGAQNLRVKRLP